MPNQVYVQLTSPSVHACRMSIIGLTDHLVHQQISPEKYTEWQIHYENRANIYAPTGERVEVTVQGRGDAGPMTVEIDTPSYGAIE